MKTILIFMLGLTFGLYSAHYYNASKTEYFDSLYTQYSTSHLNQLTAKQFEKKWLSQLPWCFNTANNQSYCNNVSTCETDEGMKTVSASNQLVDLHQKIINWYPVAKNTIFTTFGQIESYINEKMEG